MKELRKEIEKLVENEDFVSYEEFIYELEEEKEEVKKYLDWRASGGKMNTETLPEGYVEACKKVEKSTKLLKKRLLEIQQSEVIKMR